MDDAQPAAEGAAPHLVDYFQNETTQLYQNLRHDLEADFEKSLTASHWPKKELQVSEYVLDRLTLYADALLDLQEPDLKDWTATNYAEPGKPLPILLPIEVMARPLTLRFRFHFYGNKPTNRLDKPEYFLSHIIDLLESYGGFVTEVLQPTLDRRNDADDIDEPIYTDAISSLISGMMPAVSEKCLALLPQISSQPQLLSHFFHELMSFDTTIRDSWSYRPNASPLSEWKGLCWPLLTTHSYFDTWLAAERQFALQRYKSIRDGPESGDLDLESTGPRTTKPTKGAIRVNDLLETITDRYRGLMSFSHKLKFLIDIQLAIFDDYHRHLYDGLEAWKARSHTAGRLIAGQGLTDHGVFNLKGIESLLKIFGSSEYLEKKMSDWSDDIFFLELWDELQHRARGHERVSSGLGANLNLNEVAAKTSNTIVMKDDDVQETDGGALFDETAATYRRLREGAESQIVRAVEVNIRNSIKPFVEMEGRATLSQPPPDPSLLSQSASLDSLVQTLSSLLGLFYTVLAPAPLRRITRQASHAIQREIWDNVLMTDAFSLAGYAQFRRDITAIQDCIDSNIKASGEAERGMRKLMEGLVLLGLPIRSSASSKSDSYETADGEDWGFDENADTEEDHNGEATPPETDEDKVWGLWEVDKRLNRSNEDARRVLAEMGLSQLSEKEARSIVGRRVEVNA